jgi:hypothetical protein
MFASQDRKPLNISGDTAPMSSIDFDIDAQMMQLETEWRQAYEASVGARADYQKLAADPRADVTMLDMARERLDRAEAVTAQIMIKIERLEASMLGQD